mgnify:FL=1
MNHMDQILAGRRYYLPEEWPAVEAAAAQAGVNGTRMRFDLAHPDEGWRRVTVDRRNPMTEQITGEAFVLNRILQEHKIAASIDVHDIINPGRGVLIYGLTPKPGLRIAAIESRLRELTEAISTYRQQRTPVRLRHTPLALEVPHPDQSPLHFTDASLPAKPHVAAIGQSFDYNGAHNEVIDFNRTAHVLIAGTTGSGKSTLLNSLVLSLCHVTDPADLRIILVDLKNEDLVPLMPLPHMTYFAADAERAERAIGNVWAEKNRRVESGRQRYQRWVLVIDELAELTHMTDIAKPLASILAIGRSKRIHVIAATQKPTAAIVGSVAKGNFTNRLVGRVLSAEDSRTATGQAQLRCELLPGNGSFLRIDGPDPVRLQGYFMDADEVDRRVERIAAHWMRQQPLSTHNNSLSDQEPTP